MPIYDMYPYSNLHELNLNEIIKDVAECKDTIEELLNETAALANFTFTDTGVQLNNNLTVVGDLYANMIHGNVDGSITEAQSLSNAAQIGTANSPVYFSAGRPVETGSTLNKSITGSAGSAAKITTPFTLQLLGDVTGSVLMDGSGTTSMHTTIVGTTPQEISTIPNDLTIQGNLQVNYDLNVTGDTTVDDIMFTGTLSDSNDALTASVAELNYCDGVTSNIQTQLNAKQATITGAATTVVSSDLALGAVLISDQLGKIAASSRVSVNELNHLEGVTADVQTQLNAKQSTILSGTTDPAAGTGSVGDVYIKYEAPTP